MDSKKCFKCNIIKTLDKFTVNKRKYCLPSDKGTNIVCESCTKKRALKEMSLVVFNFETDRFEIIYFKTKKEVNEYFKKKS